MRKGLPAQLHRQFANELAVRLGRVHPVERVEVITTGHAAGLMAAEHAVRHFTAGLEELCLVGGVDSYLEPETLEWLEQCDQLHGAGRLCADRISCGECKCHHQTPLVLVSIEAEDPPADEATLGAILKSPFPPRAAPPFRLVEPRDLDDVKDPVLHLQFASEVSDADLAALRSVFESWDVMIEMGGYAEGSEPLEDFFIELGSTHLGGPSLVDHAAYNIRFPPATVFDAAINVAFRASVKLGTLIELSIE